jgi:hypothetical protein
MRTVADGNLRAKPGSTVQFARLCRELLRRSIRRAALRACGWFPAVCAAPRRMNKARLVSVGCGWPFLFVELP